MKKNVIAILLLSVIITSYSCKNENKEQQDQTTTETDAKKNTETSTSVAESKTYVVTATPESVLLGKNKEASIKIKDLTAIELSNPDGTSAGIELTYKIELTNKNAIGGNIVGVPTTDFRLELDNGNKIAPNSTYVSAAAEATKLSDADKFTIPPGAKPTGLVLFYDQTRAVVKLEIK